MMQGFKDVDLQWNGVTYTIKANRLLPVIAEIEDALRGTSDKPAVAILLRPGGPSYPRLAMAYSVALQAAGAAVTGDEIYLRIMQEFADGNAQAAVSVQQAVLALLAIMSPPLAMALSKAAEDDEPGEA